MCFMHIQQILVEPPLESPLKTQMAIKVTVYLAEGLIKVFRHKYIQPVGYVAPSESQNENI